MSQIFHKSTNVLAKVSILGGVFIVAALLWAGYEANRSHYVTQVGVVREQPVPFSHRHHVAGMGIDCRYCHTGAETGAFAGIPPTQTCMNCHSMIWSDSPMLEPVRESFRTGKPIEWNRVHDLPDFAYFDHSIHVKKGVACTTCHGPVGEMPLTWRAKSLHMQWCLECHRNPEAFIGDPKDVFDPHARPAAREEAREMMKKNRIRSLTDCSYCHR